MRILWDATGETLYPVGHDDGLSSGSVLMIREITKRLAEKHLVHVVCNDLTKEERRGDNLWYWGPRNHPMDADVVVMTHQLSQESDYEADKLILAHTGCEPQLGPNGELADAVDAWPVFSEVHKQLLLEKNPTIKAERVYVTGLGVDLDDYCWKTSDPPCPKDLGWIWIPKTTVAKVPGRLLYANDPARGLWDVLDIFDIVKREVPGATLHVAYDFDRQIERHKWEHSQMAQFLWDCKRRIENTPGVVSLGALTREQVIREQLECQVHVYPSNPPNQGTQTHGLMQLECAAAGAALVLSDVEAFPEVFGEGATILPVIGKYIPLWERRVEPYDYARVVLDLIREPDQWQEASRKARALAEKLTWERVVDAWEAMLATIMGKEKDGA